MKLKIVIYILFIVCSFLNAETLKEYNGNKVEPQENILNELPYNSKGKYYQFNMLEFFFAWVMVDDWKSVVYGIANSKYFDVLPQ